MKSITFCAAAAVLSGAAFAQSTTTTESPAQPAPAQPSATGTQAPTTDVRGNVIQTQQPQGSTMGAGAAPEPRGWGRPARSRDRTVTLSPQSVIPGTENGGPN